MDDGDPRWQEEYTRAAAERDAARADLKSMRSEVDAARAQRDDEVNELQHQVGSLEVRLSEAEGKADKESHHVDEALRERDEARDSVIIANRESDELRQTLETDKTGMAQALLDIRDKCSGEDTSPSGQIIGRMADEALKGSGTIIGKQLRAGIEPEDTAKESKLEIPIEMGSTKAGNVNFLEKTPNVHLHYILSDAEMDRVGHGIIEIVCHHCQTGTKVIYDVVAEDEEIPSGGKPEARAVRDDFEAAHQHHLGGLEKQWTSLCPVGHAITKVADLRSKPDEGGPP